MGNVNEFPIENATFSAVTCSMGHDFYRLSRARCIDAGKETVQREEEGEHHNKNFIMALTMDLHRPLLARGVSVSSLAGGHCAQYTRIPSNYLFHIDVQRHGLFINGSNPRMMKRDIFANRARSSAHV